MEVVSPLTCEHCHQKGEVRWNAESNKSKPTRENILRVTGGFHVETGRGCDEDFFIVCSRCDEIQP